VTIAIRPSVGWDTKSSRCDLGGTKTEIFLQRGLDSPVNKPPDGQITTRPRRAISSRVPDAVQRHSRCSAEPGPLQTPSTMDPGPAAHHAAETWRVEDARKRADGAARHPGNSGVPRTVPRVPDAVQRPSRCSAEPGPVAEPAARRAQRADGASQHPGNDQRGRST
jgi:hypothetical protein